MKRAAAGRALAPLLALFGALAPGGCSPAGEPSASEALPDPSAGWPAPAPEDVAGARCEDVGEARACWLPRGAAPPPGLPCEDGVCRVPRPVPQGPLVPPAPLGWRCTGQGLERACVLRGLDAPRFACNRAGCRRPLRLPDEADWACMAPGGALLCRAAAGAAGVPPRSEPVRGWRCGERAGHPGERLCLDLAPDLPPRGEAPWDCDVGHEPGPVRRCVPAAGPLARVGGACREATDCPAGARCLGGACLPPRPPPPRCWEDADCGPGRRCRLGACLAEEATR